MNLTEADVRAIARDEFRDTLGVRGEPIVSRVRVWPRGLPQYRLGHGERVDTLLVGGGVGTYDAVKDEVLVAWIRDKPARSSK